MAPRGDAVGGSLEYRLCPTGAPNIRVRMMTSVAVATLRLLFFRAGPQDFPYQPGLTRVLVPAAVVVNFVLASITLPPALAAISAVAAVFALSVSTRSLLRVRNLENRYEQTFHALLATSSAIALAFIAPASELVPEVMRYAQNPELLQQAEVAAKLPAGAVLVFDLLLIWNFAVSANIYRHSANLRLPLAVLVAMLISFSLLMFVGFATSLIGGLLGLEPPATGAR